MSIVNGTDNHILFCDTCTPAVELVPECPRCIAKLESRVEALAASSAGELHAISDVVVESLQAEIAEMREAISPGRQNVGKDYYCAVARENRKRLIEAGEVIKPAEWDRAVKGGYLGGDELAASGPRASKP